MKIAKAFWASPCKRCLFCACFFFRKDRQVTRFIPLLSVLWAALFVTAPAVVAQQETSMWVGRLVDNKAVFLTASRVVGKDWVLKRNGVRFGDYELVSRENGCVELRAKGGPERVRLYSDRMEIDSGGRGFVTVAMGRWQD
jgi:hypothetical protein